MKYTFNYDWFSGNIPIFSNFLSHLKDGVAHGLEIGSFEGRSSVWFLDTILTHEDSTLTCIDTFEGSMEHTEEHTRGLKTLFERNVLDNFPSGKVIVHTGKSQEVLRTLVQPKYDFIFIDGDHRALSVLEDAVLSFRLLKPGGILMFDDYRWLDPRFPRDIDGPKIAIDSFAYIYQDYVDILYKDYILIVRKKREL